MYVCSLLLCRSLKSLLSWSDFFEELWSLQTILRHTSIMSKRVCCNLRFGTFYSLVVWKNYCRSCKFIIYLYESLLIFLKSHEESLSVVGLFLELLSLQKILRHKYIMSKRICCNLRFGTFYSSDYWIFLEQFLKCYDIIISEFLRILKNY